MNFKSRLVHRTNYGYTKKREDGTFMEFCLLSFLYIHNIFSISDDIHPEILPVSLSPSQDLQFSADIPHGNDPAVPS